MTDVAEQDDLMQEVRNLFDSTDNETRSAPVPAANAAARQEATRRAYRAFVHSMLYAQSANPAFCDVRTGLHKMTSAIAAARGSYNEGVRRGFAGRCNRLWDRFHTHSGFMRDIGSDFREEWQALALDMLKQLNTPEALS